MLKLPKDKKEAHFIMSVYRGYGEDATKLANAFGIHDRTVRKWVARAKLILGNREKTKQARELLETEAVTVVYFTDAHNQPSHSLDRFELLAKFVNDVRPDYFIDGGDFDDFESLCTHVKNDTHEAKKKPSFEEDFKYSLEAHALLDNLIEVECIKHKTLGNHEQRMWIYENQNPETFNTIVPKYLDMCDKFGWEITPYGAFLDIHGVDFTHVPFNGMGKAMGGKQPHVTMCNSLMRDMVFGHTHGYGVHTAHKLGDQRHVRCLNGGSFMPDGYMPSYAKNSQKSFWYGAHKITIENGRMDVISYTMKELARMYG